jgi:hypothetical protein
MRTPANQVVAVQLFIQVLTYGYYALLVRWLAAPEFDGYIGFTACFAIYSVIGLGLQQASAREASLGQVVRLERKLRLAMLLLVAVAMPVLSVFAHLPWVWLVALGCSTPWYIVVSMWRGQQLIQAPKRLNQNLLLEHGSKILLTPVLGLFLARADAAALALVLSLAVAYWHSQWAAHRTEQVAAHPSPEQVTHRSPEQVAPMAAQPKSPALQPQVFLLFTFLQLCASNLDLLLAQRLLSAAELSVYTHASLLARVMLFVGLSLGQAQTKTLTLQASAMWQVLWRLLGLLVVYLLGIGLFGEFALHLMYGSSHSTAVWMLLVMAAGAVGAGAMVLQTALLHQKTSATSVLLALLGLQALTASVWHGSAQEMAMAMAIVGMLWLFVVLGWFIQWQRGVKNVVQRFHQVA